MTATQFDLNEFLKYLSNNKKRFCFVFVLLCLLIYLGIYFFVQEEFNATALIIPKEEDALSIASIAAAGTKRLPFSFSTKSMSSEIDLYVTLIYARTTIEDIVYHFKLYDDYNLDTTDIEWKELAIKKTKKRIIAEETDEGGFTITAIANTREKSAEIANYIVQKLNERILVLKTERSRENREFLEKRVQELQTQLRKSEDSLRAFQEHSKLLDLKTQLTGVFAAYGNLEAELTAKRIHAKVLERLYGVNSPQVEEVQQFIQEYERKIKELQTKQEPTFWFSMKDLPQKSVDFLRLYRDVEVNTLLLQYLLPLYEQAKIEEKKDYPTFQVIDPAVPPAKKSYPPRTLFALIGALFVTTIVAYVSYRYNIVWSFWLK